MGLPVVAGGKVARKMRNSRAESLKLARRWSFPPCPGPFSCVTTGDETDSRGDGWMDVWIGLVAWLVGAFL